MIRSVVKLWDAAPHNAFPDLVRHRGGWICAFREGATHVSADGLLRVLRSVDGEHWEAVALLQWAGGDLRDVDLSVTPEGRLLLATAVCFEQPVDGGRHHSVTWLSDDGVHWEGPFRCPSGVGTWRWSVAWHAGHGYSFGYTGKDKAGGLYRSGDGRSWQEVLRPAFPEPQSYPNETSMVFLDDATMLCLLRRDKGSATALLGTARPPYTDWQWRDLGVRIGGPKLLRLGDGRLLAAVRLYGAEDARTALCWIDPEQPRLDEWLALPSGGDTSYAGMVEHEGEVWVVYYASHEGRTAIYLARVGL